MQHAAETVRTPLLHPRVSVVTSLFRSAAYIDEFYRRTTDAASALTETFELVFVDDGSPDDSGDIVREIISKDARVRLVELSRNFGHAAAMLAGLTATSGDYVFAIDVDLEEAPELLIQFYELMHHSRTGVDVVFGFMSKRKGSPLEKWSGRLFYKVLRFFSGLSIPEDQVWARLMSRRYVDTVLQFEERNVYMGGLFHLSGFTQVGCPVEKLSKGTSSYTPIKRLAAALDAVTSFSIAPLIYLSLLGVAMSVIAFVAALYVVLRQLIRDDFLSGWASLIVSVWFVGGLIISSVGIVGVYVGKTYLEVKRRPRAIIRASYPPAERTRTDGTVAT